MGDWLSLERLTTADLAKPGVAFREGDYLYQTLGEVLGHGGMGNAYGLVRRPIAAGPAEPSEKVVGKVFHAEYLYQIRTDEVTRADHECVTRALDQIAALRHPHLLPIHVSNPIADNHLTISPQKDTTLVHAISAGPMAERQRARLLIQGLEGLATLHAAGFLHRDFTLRNILVDAERRNTYLFDFDLALSRADVAGQTYKTRYRGRIIGSPGYSVAPEIIEAQLMDRPVGPQLDIYAAGGAIFSLFTDELPYGPTEDMWSLLLRISDGMVFAGTSHIVYPDAVPLAVRPIIERCMEHDPVRRYETVGEIIDALRGVLDQLPDGTQSPGLMQRTFRYGDSRPRISAVFAASPDPSLSIDQLSDIDEALSRYGYQVQRSLGRVLEQPIYMAAPIRELLAQGEFPDANTYPKIVTVLSLAEEPDPDHVVDLWLGAYLPILRAARQGLLTPLHRVVHDQGLNALLLFSEYVDDARFGPALDEHDLTLEEAFGIAYLVSRQVRQLHRRGLAHNNVGASALLFKGLPDSRRVHPAMVGLVSPSLDPEAMAGDVRALARLSLQWIRSKRIERTDASTHARLSEIHRALAETAAGNAARQIDALLEVLADGLSALDFNFGVLRENEGDLDAYALLLVSHALYGRLW